MTHPVPMPEPSAPTPPDVPVLTVSGDDADTWLTRAATHYTRAAELATEWESQPPRYSDHGLLRLYRKAAREGQQGILAAGIANAILNRELLT
jgi:hypothetical protein